MQMLSSRFHQSNMWGNEASIINFAVSNKSVHFWKYLNYNVTLSLICVNSSHKCNTPGSYIGPIMCWVKKLVFLILVDLAFFSVSHLWKYSWWNYSILHCLSFVLSLDTNAILLVDWSNNVSGLKKKIGVIHHLSY